MDIQEKTKLKTKQEKEEKRGINKKLKANVDANKIV